MKRPVRRVLALAGAMLLGCTIAAVPVPGQPTAGMQATSMKQVVVFASADTYSEAGRPRGHNGSSPTLRFGRAGRARAYLRFRIPAFRGTVTRAELHMTTVTRTPHRTFLSTTSATWNERGLAWPHAPAVGARLSQAPSVRAKSRLRFDVTSAVAPGRRLDVVVTGRGSGVVRSSESVRQRPRLQLTLAGPEHPEAAGWQPTFPIRATFYYPWYPESWRQQGFDPFTRYTPALGLYDSSSPSVLRAHIDALVYSGLQAGISSWWGPGDETDRRFPELLAATVGRPLRWAIYYEREGIADPSPTDIAVDLTYIDAHYGHDPSYLQVDGRPVVFVYADARDGCGMAHRWNAAQPARGFYVV
ncbi:MAG TPA: DNRLRE domain-containing protein, partial [Nocardioides sp.]